MSDHFREREIRRFNIKVTFDNLEIGSDLAEEVVGFLIGQVT